MQIRRVQDKQVTQDYTANKQQNQHLLPGSIGTFSYYAILSHMSTLKIQDTQLQTIRIIKRQHIKTAN